MPNFLACPQRTDHYHYYWLVNYYFTPSHILLRVIKKISFSYYTHINGYYYYYLHCKERKLVSKLVIVMNEMPV